MSNPCALRFSFLVPKPKAVTLSVRKEAKNTTTSKTPTGEWRTSVNAAAISITSLIDSLNLAAFLFGYLSVKSLALGLGFLLARGWMQIPV